MVIFHRADRWGERRWPKDHVDDDHVYDDGDDDEDDDDDDGDDDEEEEEGGVEPWRNDDGDDHVDGIIVNTNIISSNSTTS